MNTFRNKKFWIIIICILVLLNSLLTVFYQPLTQFGKKVLSRQPTYYAVHLNSGQAYFGQIESIKEDILVFKNVYFLEEMAGQTNQNLQGENFQVQLPPEKTYNLVKRGGDNFAAADGTLFINRSTVLFWEKLKPDSEIVKQIEKASSR